MKTKRVAIRNGRGEITGYITMYWSEALKAWVTIPEEFPIDETAGCRHDSRDHGICIDCGQEEY